MLADTFSMIDKVIDVIWVVSNVFWLVPNSMVIEYGRLHTPEIYIL